MGFNYDARYYLKELFTRLGWYSSANTSQAHINPKKLFTQKVQNLYWFIYKNFPMRYKQKMAGLFPIIRSRVEAIVDNVGWDRTRVYSNDDFFSIFINRISRDGEALFPSKEAYFNFRNEIIKKLYALEELGTKEPLVKKVYTPEQVYFGDYVSDAPDLIIEWAEVRLKKGIRCGDITILPEGIKKSKLDKILSGEHRPYGILLMKGEMFQKGCRIANGSVLDIAPTILYLAGHPIPQSMDGKVLLDAFQNSFRVKNPVEYTDVIKGIKREEKFSFSDEESLKVEERLRAMGYIE